MSADYTHRGTNAFYYKSTATIVKLYVTFRDWPPLLSSAGNSQMDVAAEKKELRLLRGLQHTLGF